MRRIKPQSKRPGKKPAAVAAVPVQQAKLDGMATVTEAASFLQFCTKTIDRMIKSGRLRSKKIGRSRRIPWSALREISGDRTAATA